MKTKLLALLIFNFSFLIFNCEAATRFVSKTGTATPPYTTWATASDSIQKCINICNDGDTVVVANGVYREYLVIHKNISLIGSSMDSTVVDGRNLFYLRDRDTTILITADSVEIKNFDIIGFGKNTSSIVIVIDFQDNFILENCKIHNSYLGVSAGYTNCDFSSLMVFDITVGGLGLRSFLMTEIFVVRNSVVTVNPGSNTGPISCVGFGKYYLYGNVLISPQNDVRRGIFFDAELTSVLKNNIISSFRDVGVRDAFDITDTTIMHNNLFLHVSPNIININWNDGRHMSFRNNIIAYNATGFKNSKGVVRSDYNIYWQNQTNISGGIVMGEHDLIVDPMFVKDVAPHLDSTYDFHLQKYSPAIDAGDPEILDVDGSRSDIGLFGGPFGEKYTYQDLAPRTPKQLTAAVDSAFIKLNWLQNTEADLFEYILYRDTVTGFDITKDKIIYRGSENYFSDLLSMLTAKQYYYKVTAIDSQMNQSAASAEVAVILVGVEPIVKNNDYLLYHNYPNPFNPATKIGYHIKERAYIKLMVYDIKGELISVLVNGEQSAGYHEVEFNTSGARNEQIEKEYGSFASGIYLYRIEVINENNIPVYSDMKKMILLK